MYRIVEQGSGCHSRARNSACKYSIEMCYLTDLFLRHCGNCGFDCLQFFISFCMYPHPYLHNFVVSPTKDGMYFSAFDGEFGHVTCFSQWDSSRHEPGLPTGPRRRMRDMGRSPAMVCPRFIC